MEIAVSVAAQLMKLQQETMITRDKNPEKGQILKYQDTA